MTTPFTYLLTNHTTGLRYYGVKYARGCHPDMLGDSYWSSSKKIKGQLERGDVFTYEVRKIFEAAEQACEWEHRVLRRLNAVKSPLWINETDNRGKFYQTGPKSEIHRSRIGRSNSGKTRSIEARRKVSLSRTGMKIGPMGDDHKKKISDSHTGKKMPEGFGEKIRAIRTGTTASDDTKKKMSLSKAGTKQSPEQIRKRVESTRRTKLGKK